MDGSQGVGSVILPGTGRGTSEAGGGALPRAYRPATLRARKLRSEMSLPEVMLWNQLRRQQLGFKVRRQHPIGDYDADFYVSSARLVIEVDGDGHGLGNRPEYDAGRDRFMIENGYSILRVSAVEVMTNLRGVIEAILARVETPLHHPADGPPPPAGEER